MTDRISQQRKFQLIFLTILLGVLLPFLCWIAKPFVAAFLIATVLAIVLQPVFRFFSRRTGRPVLAAALTTIVTLVLLGGLLFGATVALTKEVADTYSKLNKLSEEEGGWPALVSHTSDRVLAQVERHFPINRQAIQTDIMVRLKELTGTILVWTGGLLSGITTGIFNFVLSAIFLFLMLQHGPAWIDALIQVLPLEHGTTRSLMHAVRDSIVANVNGVLAVAMSQAVLLAIGFSAAGIRSPVLWACIGGLASVIPLVGGMIIWIPVVVGLAVQAAYLKAILLGLWCALVVGSADNVIRPWVVSGTVQQHPILIALTMLGGTSAFGPPGVLFGPVILSLALAVWIEINRALRQTSIEAPKTA